ncbi:MAG: protease HtpX [Zoogloeaceae bacterium]|jgi:heat shock protein HtpX|nr:protease HtpX [Zoogloeaceae bacterium]
MKRVLLLILTNVAVMVVLSIVAALLGVDRYFTESGLNFSALLLCAAVFGFGGAFISLLLSKFMAKHTMGVRLIDPRRPNGETENWLAQTVERLARRANIGMPEVGIYEGAPNAFATGANRNAALVAVSTGLLRGMERREVEAVLGHEIAHVANGDMVTLTLIQGVVNTFVFFLARVIGFVVDSALSKGRGNQSYRPGATYYAVVVVLQIVLGILASAVVAWFSRQREYRADAGSAAYLGAPQPMISALRRLEVMASEPLPESMAASGIAGGRLSNLFASHPSIEARIAALEARREK